MGTESISQLGLAFFGLTFDTVPQARAALFTQIHEICFYGQGGYDWSTVYDMPVWLRRFTFNKINEHYKNEKQQVNYDSCDKRIKTFLDKYEIDNANDKEVCSLALIADLLALNGTAVAVLKEGVFFDPKYSNIRKTII